MEYRDSHYYQANAAEVNLEEITSSAQNAKILQRLRDGDPTLRYFHLRRDDGWGKHCVGEGDDMGWLGYFIGKSQCLQSLYITYLPNGEEAYAFAEGIARSQSIWYIGINNLSNDGFTSIVRALGSQSQLEELDIWGDNSVGPDADGWSELRTLLESGVCHLKQLRLSGNNYIGNAGIGILSNGLRGIGTSLKVLEMENNSIGNEGLLAVVSGLQNCTSLELEKLFLSGNDFSSAAAGLGSLSDWLQNSPMNLTNLCLENCRISDVGLHALAEGAANHCEILDLDGNASVTSTGLNYLSNSIRSDSCRVETLFLQGIPIGDDGLEVLGQGLVGNQSLTSLHLDDMPLSSAGWLAFSRALCDTSSVNSTYLSNHTICSICDDLDVEINLPQDISLHLQLNKEHPQHATRCKILMSHRHLDMKPFLQWKLKFLPLAVAWFERAMPCTSLTIHDEDLDSTRRVLDESNDAFQSRALSAMYEFVRGMPMEVMKSREELIVMAYDDKIAMAEEEIKMLREDVEQRERNFTQVEEEKERLKEENKGAEEEIKMLREDLKQRDRKITQLEEENERLEEENKGAEEEIKRRSEDVEQRDRKIPQLEEENERLSKIALFLCVFAVFLSSKSFSLLLELMRSSRLDL